MTKKRQAVQFDNKPLRMRILLYQATYQPDQNQLSKTIEIFQKDVVYKQ